MLQTTKLKPLTDQELDAMAETLVRTASRDDLVRRVEEAASAESLFRGSF